MARNIGIKSLHAPLVIDDYRCDEQGHDGQRKINSSQRDEVKRDHHPGRRQPRQPLCEEELDLVHIVRDARHELAALVGVEKAHALRLHVRIQGIPQVVDHPLSDKLLQVGLDRGHAVGEDGSRDEEQDVPQYEAHVALTDAVVNDELGQPRRGHA